MKYTFQSGKYLLKNFFYILPFTVFPALFFSLSTDERAMTGVLQAMLEGRLEDWSFRLLFRSISILSFSSWQSVVFGIIGILLSVLCVALLMALLEKHLRIGKRSFNGIWEKLNDNFLSTCWYTALLVLIYEIWALLAAAILYFVSMISVRIVAYAAIVVFFLLLHLLLLFAISMIYLWLPCMQITGFGAFESLQYSYQLFAPVKWNIIWGQTVLLLVSEIIICLCALFVESRIVFLALTTALYALMTMFFCVRMQITYFERDNIERADLNRYYME